MFNNQPPPMVATPQTAIITSNQHNTQQSKRSILTNKFFGLKKGFINNLVLFFSKIMHQIIINLKRK